MRNHNIAVLGILLGLLFAVAHIGAAKSERAHRALDLQYQQCEEQYGFGSHEFVECVR